MNDVDRANEEFWNELCGTSLARHLGIKDHREASLRTFDDFYFTYYPYLWPYVDAIDLAGKTVLEIGLGYGTLGQKIAEHCGRYCGLDVARGPVSMMQHRLQMKGLSGEVKQGSVLEAPFADESMDHVVSIGCFHHTGNLQRAVDEAHRLLKPGGKAVIMLYNKYSYRQWVRWPVATFRHALHDSTGMCSASGVSTAQRKAYDASAAGQAAPETVFTSCADVRRLFRQFRQVQVGKENNDVWVTWGRTIARERMLNNLGKWLGLDLYVTATK